MLALLSCMIDCQSTSVFCCLHVLAFRVWNFFCQIRLSRLEAYINNKWNLLTVFALITYAVGIVLQHVANVNCFEAARIFRSFNFMLLMYMLLQYFCILPFVGPLITMFRLLVSILSIYWKLFFGQWQKLLGHQFVYIIYAVNNISEC